MEKDLPESAAYIWGLLAALEYSITDGEILAIDDGKEIVVMEGGLHFMDIFESTSWTKAELTWACIF